MDALKIGWSRKEISIDGPVNITGQMHMRRSEGIADPLYATALCFDGGKGCDCVIFCSIDIILLCNGVTFETIDKLKAERPDIPSDNVIFNATHSHTSMDANNELDSFPDGASIINGIAVKKHLIQKLFDAVCEAFDTRKEGGIAFGYGFAVVGHSRRSLYSIDKSTQTPNVMTPNGHAIMYGKTNDPYFCGYEAGADHFLNAMYTFDNTGKLTGIIVNVPCPSQTSEIQTKLSADYWCEVRENVKNIFGSDVFVLSQCAAAGDLSPRILHYLPAQLRRFRLKYGITYTDDDTDLTKAGKKAMGERYDIGERIGAALKEIYEWAKKDIITKVPVYHESKCLALERRFITEEELSWCNENVEKLKKLIPEKDKSTPDEYRVAITQYNSAVNRNSEAISRYELQKVSPTRDAVVHCVRIGDVAFATNRFELYMDFMHRIQARSPFVQTFVVQLAGDEEPGCYLATKRAQENKGYGASLFCNHVSADGGQQIVEESLQMLNDMYNK